MDKKVNIAMLTFFNTFEGIPPQKNQKKEKYIKEFKSRRVLQNISRI
ncbi:hypothetical protein ONA02_02755 [Mycoplasmopsis felis]|nr:hypothetical protein [Mycoplasmopsis felis]WAM02719.1 hypothetical protein ONA02_02755 [Mycoplasmopsis felis]